MSQVEADSARVDAMPGNTFRGGMGRITGRRIASSRGFDQLPHLFRVDGSKDSKQLIVPSSLRALEWLEHSETSRPSRSLMGFASLNPSY